MAKLLLLSNGTINGNYLTYAHSWIRDHFDSSDKPKSLFFVPYAKADHNAWEKKANEALEPIGIKLLSAHRLTNLRKSIDQADGICVIGGNTYRLLYRLREYGVLPAIREKVLAGMPYMGISAGINIVAPTIFTTNDMPNKWPVTPMALNLISFQINPHYVPGKLYYYDDGKLEVYNGETRDQRIAEYHEENDLPVVGLREGSALRIADTAVELLGNKRARIFEKGKEFFEVDAAEINSPAVRRILRMPPQPT